MAAKKSKDQYYAVWPTAWGPIGAVWAAQGLSRLVLPHYPLDDLKQLLAWEHKGTVENEKPFQRLIELSRNYFNAQPTDFSEIECDLPAESSFSGLVYRACRKIEFGQTLSYSALGREIRREDSARAVATAMSKNRIPLVVPCHRVIYNDGRPGGFSAEGGEPLKLRMLALENPA